MGNLNGEFNAADIPEQSLIPAGEYVCAIIGSEVKDNKARTGSYIKLTIEVIDGPHSGRRFWPMLNLWNENSKTVEIAQRELASICRATGIMSPSDTSELHNIPIGVKIGISPGKDGYDDSNKASKYYEVGGSVVDGPPPAPAPAAGPAWKTGRR